MSRTETPSAGDSPLLSVRELGIGFRTANGLQQIVDHVSFEIYPNETLCIVGESGCGKSLTAMSVLQLLPRGAQITSGQILWGETDLATLNEAALTRIRGGQIGVIFQEPMSSLNPVMRIGDQVLEALILHRSDSKKVLRERAIELLSEVGIDDARRRYRSYPHQFSGGMLQRVMIAIAIANAPRMLIADEPTTALDVTIQHQILTLLGELKTRNQMALLLISHDLGLVAEIADRVAVMYAGRLVEIGSTQQIFASPNHPYTAGLINCRPHPSRKRLQTIRGSVPPPEQWMTGCRFSDRCSRRIDPCAATIPPEIIQDGRHTYCHNPLSEGPKND